MNVQERKKERRKERKGAKQTSPKGLDTTNWTPTPGPSQFSNCVQGGFIGKTILRYDWGGGTTGAVVQ